MKGSDMETDEKTIHDYTSRFWGWNYSCVYPIKGREEAYTMLGIGKGVKEGDYLKMTDDKKIDQLMKVEKIKYSDNPKDMYHATIAMEEQ